MTPAPSKPTSHAASALDTPSPPPTPPPHWPELKALFDRASTANSATARELALAQAPPHLRAQVESLLAHLDAGHDELESPAWDLATNPSPVGQAHRALPSLAPGTRIGQFTLGERLGEGGMGAVYRADQSTPQRTVAIKILSTPVPSARNLRRFAHEGQSLARFKHPSIVGIIEMGQTQPEPGSPPRPYLAMDLVAGRPLLDAVRDWPMDRAGIRRRIALLTHIAEAIEHAHQRGVWHRDLKSSNILVDDTDTPHVLDFGVAALSERDADAREEVSPDEAATGSSNAGSSDASVATSFSVPFTAASVAEHRHLVGTYFAMAPELLLTGQNSHHADIHALGLLAWEAITGAWPFTTVTLTPTPTNPGSDDSAAPDRPNSYESALRLARKREQNLTSTSTPTPTPTPTATTLRALRQALGRTAADDLLLILRKALAFEPSQRYQSAGALATDLQRLAAHEPISLRPRSTRYLLNRFARRRPAFAATIAGALLVTLATSSIATWQAVRATRASNLANERLKRSTEMIGTITRDLHASLNTVPEAQAARAEILRLATETAKWMSLEATDSESLTHVARAFMRIALNEGSMNGNSLGNTDKGRLLMDEAISMVRRAVAISPNASFPRWILGQTLMNRAMFEHRSVDQQSWSNLGLEAYREAVALSPEGLTTPEERLFANNYAYSLTLAAIRERDLRQSLTWLDEADTVVGRCLAIDPQSMEHLIERTLQKRFRAGLLVESEPTRAIEIATGAREEFRTLLPRDAVSDTPLNHIAQCGLVIAEALVRLRRFDEAEQEVGGAHALMLAACRAQPSNTFRLGRTWELDVNACGLWTTAAEDPSTSLEQRRLCVARARKALERAREVHAMRVKVLQPGTMLNDAEKDLNEQEQRLDEVEARLPK